MCVGFLPVHSPACWAGPFSLTLFTKMVSIGSKRDRGQPALTHKQFKFTKPFLHINQTHNAESDPPTCVNRMASYSI